MSLRFAAALVVSVASIVAAQALAQDSGFTVRKTEVKAEPFTDAGTVGSLAEKAQVRVVARQGGWMKVESPAASGWVRMLAIRTAAAAETKTGDSGIGALFNVARTGSSGTAVATGVRGLDKEQIQNAKPNPAELEKLSRFRAAKTDAERFADGKPALKAQSVDYLPVSDR
jgi:hypothetical protein